LLHYTRCLAHEQAEQPQPVKALSIAPGVVDTQMQTQLRSKTEAETAVAGRFQRMKATGELTPPDQAAREVLEIMFDPQAPAGEALDTRAYHG
jgi:benzil reductase ((S)-benzoin forming)